MKPARLQPPPLCSCWGLFCLCALSVTSCASQFNLFVAAGRILNFAAICIETSRPLKKLRGYLPLTHYKIVASAFRWRNMGKRHDRCSLGPVRTISLCASYKAPEALQQAGAFWHSIPSMPSAFVVSTPCKYSNRADLDGAVACCWRCKACAATYSFLREA